MLFRSLPGNKAGTTISPILPMRMLKLRGLDDSSKAPQPRNMSVTLAQNKSCTLSAKLYRPFLIQADRGGGARRELKWEISPMPFLAIIY